MAGTTTDDVTFFSGPGLRVAARIYRPAVANDRKAGIVFCHGFSGTKEGTPPGLATLLAQSGYTVLTFDYRGFGGSEGPLGRIVPSEQVEDVVHALEFLAQDGAVNPERIGLYGNSFGGGVALLAATRSEWPKALVLSVPVVSGSHWLRAITRWYEFKDLKNRAMKAIARKTVSGEMEMVDRFEIMIPDPLSRSRYTEKVLIALETFHHVLAHEPLAAADRLRIPAIVYGVRDDQLVPFEQTTILYDRLTSTKELHVFDSDNHFAVYDALLPTVASKTIAWFERYLGSEDQK